ncbi:MAG: ABC transporter ATP-binding protein [Ruminococcaceae bacterium]|nr:ABC transporter ATP-binding protein [Oscillospiraceae bacterium]
MQLFKKFAKYYKPYKAVFFLDMLCALVVSAVDLAFPQILSILTKTFFTQQSNVILNGLLKLGLALFFMYVIRTACRFYVTYQGHVMGAKMESDMRQDLFDQYERFSFSYYDRSNTGEMMSKLVSDLFDISELAHHGPENIFISAIKIIGSFVLLLMINVPLTLILSAVVVVMVLFSLYQNDKMQETFMDNRRKIASVNASLQDSLAGIRVVKSFANEEMEHKKFQTSNQQFLVSKESNYLRMGIFHSGNNFFEGMLFLTVLVAGGYFIAQGTLNAADLAVYALYINIFINPIEVLIEFTELLQKGISGFRRFTEVMETVPEIQDDPNAAELTNVKGSIDYKDVSFRYNEEESVLEHINVHVDAGRSVALVGPSGGGKSTLCSLLPRFYDVTSGAVCIDGKDVRTLTQQSLHNAIGIVQQDVYLFGGTVRENIAYGKPNATMDEIVEAAKEANIHDFILTLPDGYDTFVGERGARLSGGQKQRISIARVFLKNPPMLILDEATSALDNESEQYIQKSLDKLAHGRTTITIAHRLSTIRNADEIIVIDNDGIRERGTHETLLAKNGLYAKYYNMQFQGK